MEVRIIISGLCHFVPDAGQMQVLMPISAGSHRHVASLEFDIAHLTPGNTALAKISGQYSLRDLMLSFPTNGSGANTTLCQQIANLRPVTGSGPTSTLLQTNPTGPLASRVTLQSGGNTMVEVGSACWNVAGLQPQPRRLAHRALWSIPNLSDGGLTLVPTRFNGAAAPISFPTLYPIPLPAENGQGPVSNVIRLFLHYVPADDLPPDPVHMARPADGFQPPHFSMFYSLFSSPANTPVPVLVPLGAPCDVAGACPELHFAGGSPFTCMLTGTQP